MEFIDFCSVKPDGKLTKEKALEIKQHIDDVQNDLDFICDWWRHDLKVTNDMDRDVCSSVHGEAHQAWNYLQTVYRFLAKVIDNAEDK